MICALLPLRSASWMAPNPPVSGVVAQYTWPPLTATPAGSFWVGDDHLLVVAVEVGRPDRAMPVRKVGAAGPVDVVGVDRQPAHDDTLAGDDRMDVAAVEADHPDRTIVGARDAGPVKVAGVHRDRVHVALVRGKRGSS